MKKSDFQFTNPCLSALDFRENPDFDAIDGREIVIRNQIAVNRNDVNESEAMVSIRIILGDESNESPFYLKAEVGAMFKWAKGLAKDKVDSLLGHNAPALLLSYSRPIIAMVTNSSHCPAYNIPFVDFTSGNEKEIKQN